MFSIERPLHLFNSRVYHSFFKVLLKAAGVVNYSRFFYIFIRELVIISFGLSDK